MFEKKFFLKRIGIRQEMDLKIPKALSNRVFNNGYSKHFRFLVLNFEFRTPFGIKARNATVCCSI